MIAYKRWGCWIKIHRCTFPCSDAKLAHHWTGYRFDNFMRWKWYFRYRAALLQVQNPKCYIEMKEYQYDVELDKKEAERHHRAKLTAARRKLTEAINKVERGKKEWNKLFSFEEYPDYQRASEIIEGYKARIVRLEEEINAKYPTATPQQL